MLKKNMSVRPAAWRDTHISSLRRVDAAALAATLVLTQLLRFGFEQEALRLGQLTMPYWLVGAVLGATWWGWLELRGARDVRLIGYAVEENRQVVSATLVLFGALAILSYVLNVPMARSYVVIALPLGTLLLLAGRGLVRRGLTRRRLAGEAMSRTLVVGRVPGVVEMLRSLQQHPAAGFDPVAVYAPSSSRALPHHLARVRMPENMLPAGEAPSVEGIVAACRTHRIETLVMAASAPLSSEEVRHLSWYLADERIRLVLDTGLTDVAGPRIHTQQLAGLPLIHVSTPRMSRSRLLLKRLVDLTGALTALVLLAPVMLVLAAIVKAHDGGPVLFAQERIGLDGTTFRMLKFRSMYTDAEERKAALMAANDAKGGVLFFMENDPRVTSPGAVDAQVQPRRAPAVPQRPHRRDVPGGPAPAAALGGRPVRGARPPPAAGQARHHRPVAGLRPRRPGVGAGRAPGPLLRGELVPGPGLRDPAAHGQGRGRQGGGALRRPCRCPCVPKPKRSAGHHSDLRPIRRLERLLGMGPGLIHGGALWNHAPALTLPGLAVSSRSPGCGHRTSA